MSFSLFRPRLSQFRFIDSLSNEVVRCALFSEKRISYLRNFGLFLSCNSARYVSFGRNCSSHRMPKSCKGSQGKGSKAKSSTKSPDTSTEEKPQLPFQISKDGGITIKIHAKPGAKQNAITDISPDGIGVQISAPPKEGEANEELVKYLASILGTKKSTVTLEKGSRSREKTIKIADDKLTVQQIKNVFETEIQNS